MCETFYQAGGVNHGRRTSRNPKSVANPVFNDVKKKKYCRFKQFGIKYVDYKDGEFLKFLNEQARFCPAA